MVKKKSFENENKFRRVQGYQDKQLIHWKNEPSEECFKPEYGVKRA